MDSAVALVQTYLRINGYFTVSEYPIVELRRGFQAATDMDVLAFRFSGAERVIPGEDERGRRRHSRFRVDPRLCVPMDQADMIVGEVKEGLAEFNRAGRRPEVLGSALARFGCCPAERVPALVEELVSAGQTVTPHGHAIRLVAFGSSVSGADEPYLRIPLGHVTRFLEEWIDEHWKVMRHTQLKDPVLAFLVTLAKARRGRAEE